MGFLSNIGSALKSVVAAPVEAVAAVVKAAPAAVVKAIAPVMNVATVSFVHPIQTVQAIISPTKTVAQVVEKHFEQPLSSQLIETTVSTLGYGLVAGGTAAVVAKGVAASAAALIPTTLKGAAVAAVAYPTAIGVTIAAPSILGKVLGAPQELALFAGDAATLLTEKPTLEGAKSFLEQHPYLTAATALAALTAAGFGALKLSGLIASFYQTKAAKKFLDEDIPKEKDIPIKTEETIAPTAPITPKTERVVTTAAKTSGKKRKSSIKAPTQNISQRVNVIVANKANSTGIRQTHKYLNRELLIN